MKDEVKIGTELLPYVPLLTPQELQATRSVSSEKKIKASTLRPYDRSGHRRLSASLRSALKKERKAYGIASLRDAVRVHTSYES